jgi:hypothetical protein
VAARPGSTAAAEARSDGRRRRPREPPRPRGGPDDRIGRAGSATPSVLRDRPSPLAIVVAASGAYLFLPSASIA